MGLYLVCFVCAIITGFMVSLSTGGLAKVPMAEIKTRVKGVSLALRVRLPDDSTINVASDTEMEVSELKQIILVP